MNLTLRRENQRRRAARALRSFQSDHQRDKQASQEAFEWCVIGVVVLFLCVGAFCVVLTVMT